MAEAFARMHGGANVNAYSAGSRPSGVVNPKAVAAMSELGYDLSQHRSLSLDDIPQIEYDVVATMGCGDACPHVSAKHREDWAIDDPRDMSESDFRIVRDDIQARVKALLESITKG